MYGDLLVSITLQNQYKMEQTSVNDQVQMISPNIFEMILNCVLWAPVCIVILRNWLDISKMIL